MRVERWNEHEEGPLNEASLRRKLERLGYSVNVYVYPPGTYFPPHKHEDDKLDAVLRGRFRLAINGDSEVLGPGDIIAVPCGVEHEAEVIGDKPVVSLDGIKIR